MPQAQRLLRRPRRRQLSRRLKQVRSMVQSHNLAFWDTMQVVLQHEFIDAKAQLSMLMSDPKGVANVFKPLFIMSGLQGSDGLPSGGPL